MRPKPLKTFIIYSSKDKGLCEELESHLRPLVDLGWLDAWSDKEIQPGEPWDAAIKKRLLETELFLMLVSMDFYNSGYIREEEFKTAIARLESGDALIIPIIVRHCTWKNFPVIKDLQVLPPGGVPVNDRTYWQDHDKAWVAVVEKIEERVEGLFREQSLVAVPFSDDTPRQIQITPEKIKKSSYKHQQPQNGQPLRDLSDTPEMVFVEGGTFRMGSNEYESEMPIHTVIVPSFWIGKYPVTFEEYDHFCTETKREKTNDNSWGRGRRPVINVTWDDAQAYCEWLSLKTGKKYRLPAEAEWEFAAKGGILSKGYTFAGGNDPDKEVWYGGNSGAQTHPVGEKTANELGLLDMSGNVWEWCADNWHDNYAGAPVDGSTWTQNGDNSSRVLRGGAWGSSADYCRPGDRHRSHPVDWDSDRGFRLARDH